MISNTKVLKSAKPTIRLADGVVKKWKVEVVLEETITGWKRTYEGEEDVEYMNLQPEAFTPAELITYISDQINVIFNAHYDSVHAVPTEEVNDDFDINDLTQPA